MVHIEEDHETKSLEIIHKHKVFENINFILSAAENVEEGILQFSEKEHADLLAFYKPHRYFWEQLYRSSLTRKFLFKSRTPLLLFN
jgi:hypothetical protein